MWTTAAGALTVAAWLDGLGATPSALKWTMLCVCVAASAAIIRYFGSLKHVWRKGDELIVGDPRRGLRIHLTDVREIKESHFQQIKTVTLKLRRPTALGGSITFVPRGARPPPLAQPHPAPPIGFSLRQPVTAHPDAPRPRP